MILYNDRQRGSGLNRGLRVAVGVMWLTALAIVSFYLPVVAAEADGNPQADSISSPKTFFYDDLARSIDGDDVAQFQLPKHKPEIPVPQTDGTTPHTSIGLIQQDEFPSHVSQLVNRLFEYGHDAVLVVDVPADSIVAVNPAACELLGYEEHELLDTRISKIHLDEMAYVRAFDRDVQRLGHLQWAPIDSVLQALAVNVRHRDKSVPVGLINLVDRANVGMVEGSCGLRFVHKTGLFVLGPQGLGREEFQGDRAFELCVLGLVDHTHPTFPEFIEDLVMRDGFTDHW